jgi:hypothetical protein
MRMSRVTPSIVREPWDVDRRLKELGLTRLGLDNVRRLALHERGTATPFHAANAAGTLAYQHGTWGLRNEFVGRHWTVDRELGVEAIRNDQRKVRVAFANVDLTCVDDHTPRPRTEKGSGAERITSSDLFDDLPHSVSVPVGNCAFYYLMLGEDGGAELTWPVIRGGKFVATIERIYLANGGDDEPETLSLDDGGIADGFDPQVARKK